MDYKQFIQDNYPRYRQCAMIGQIKMLRAIVRAGSVPTVEEEPVSPLRAMFISAGGNLHAVQVKLDGLELLALKYATRNYYAKLAKSQGKAILEPIRYNQL